MGSVCKYLEVGLEPYHSISLHSKETCLAVMFSPSTNSFLMGSFYFPLGESNFLQFSFLPFLLEKWGLSKGFQWSLRLSDNILSSRLLSSRTKATEGHQKMVSTLKQGYPRYWLSCHRHFSFIYLSFGRFSNYLEWSKATEWWSCWWSHHFHCYARHFWPEPASCTLTLNYDSQNSRDHACCCKHIWRLVWNHR